LRVVCLGGGTGLPAVLGGLARLGRRGGALPRLDITAGVGVRDVGGSSGRLRREQGMLPPGDLRNCLVALADRRHRGLARLFQYRFGAGRGLKGHALGNLLISALTSLEGDFLAAIRRAEALLQCDGHVLPATLEPVQLLGLLADGSQIRGERKFDQPRSTTITRVELVPRAPRAAPGVIEAIRTADVVVLGPGSLYSSVIPNLLVDGVAEALRESTALRVLVQNLMTQTGETDGLDAAGHVRAVQAHAGDVVDVLLVDPLEELGPSQRAGYAQLGQRPVHFDRRAVAALGVLPLEADLLARGRRIRHDPEKAAAAILGLALHASEA
jgi:uncharacterized cofD-like protein